VDSTWDDLLTRADTCLEPNALDADRAVALQEFPGPGFVFVLRLVGERRE
jgi:hypothetical protein